MSDLRNLRTGIGFDVHRLVEGRKLILGGVDIPYEKGLDGHSDADVLIHAIMDALLGAGKLGDIGRHFPDTSSEYKGISSLELLRRVGGLLEKEGLEIINIDSVVMAQAPKLARHIPSMEKNLAETLALDLDRINVKATTTEHLGFTGRKEGIAVTATALLLKK